MNTESQQDSGTIMAQASKIMKLVTGSDSTALPTLEDFPDYIAEREKLHTVSEQFEQASNLLANVNRSLAWMNAATSNHADEVARARLEDRQEPVKIVLKADRDKLEFDVQVWRSAVMQQSDRVRELRDRYANEIFERTRPQHRRLMDDILTATVALSEALDAEDDFVRDLQRLGVSVTALPRYWKIFNAVGSRRQWTSGVNEAGRLISAYVGRAWDHSQVQR
jgi:hypothetical protein